MIKHYQSDQIYECEMVAHVEHTEQNTNSYRIMLGKHEGQTNFEDVRADGRIILKLILKKG